MGHHVSFATIKSGDDLKSFVEYCEKHPDERFWQALRNWSPYNAIYGLAKGAPIDVAAELESSADIELKDTFYL